MQDIDKTPEITETNADNDDFGSFIALLICTSILLFGLFSAFMYFNDSGKNNMNTKCHADTVTCSQVEALNSEQAEMLESINKIDSIASGSQRQILGKLIEEIELEIRILRQDAYSNSDKIDALEDKKESLSEQYTIYAHKSFTESKSLDTLRQKYANSVILSETLKSDGELTDELKLNTTKYINKTLDTEPFWTLFGWNNPIGWEAPLGWDDNHRELSIYG